MAASVQLERSNEGLEEPVFNRTARLELTEAAHLIEAAALDLLGIVSPAGVAHLITISADLDQFCAGLSAVKY